MKKQILFIHSAGSQKKGEGSGRLISFLRNALEGDFNILSPLMPEPENPRYHAWKTSLQEQFSVLDREVILIGHSLGGSVLLKFLSEERTELKIAGLFLIATPFWGLKNWKIKEFMFPGSFRDEFPLISNFFLYHSREDEWVPFGHLTAYTKLFPQAHVRVLDGNEHEFFYGLPELVDDIRALNPI